MTLGGTITSRHQNVAPAPAAAATGAIEWRREARRVSYETALSEMTARARDIAAGAAREQVWLLEHEAVLTGGTSADDRDLLVPGAVPVHRTGRGGQWTWHGPGQRVAYVMLDLSRRHGTVPARDVRAYVQGLERWLIATLARLGIEGFIREGRVGIWVPDPLRPGFDNKIAAIGVRLTRWVSLHGVALNVAPDLSEFARIVPCGIAGHGVTSLAALGVAVGEDELDHHLREAWATVF